MSNLPIGEHAYNTQWNNFSPSIGLAWSKGRTVLRAGYSVAYDREGNSAFGALASPFHLRLVRLANDVYGVYRVAKQLDVLLLNVSIGACDRSW